MRVESGRFASVRWSKIVVAVMTKPSECERWSMSQCVSGSYRLGIVGLLQSQWCLESVAAVTKPFFMKVEDGQCFKVLQDARVVLFHMDGQMLISSSMTVRFRMLKWSVCEVLHGHTPSSVFAELHFQENRWTGNEIANRFPSILASGSLDALVGCGVPRGSCFQVLSGHTQAV